MKRGLVKLDPAETTPSVFSMRLDDLQARARASGVSVVLIYADVSRSNGIDFLTNFCLYWNEAVLAVPAVGCPALIMKLSKRVQPWILQTSIVKDVRSGPRLVENIAGFVHERCGPYNCKVALNDMDWWPNATVNGLRTAMPEAELVNMSGAIRQLRIVPDKEEAALLQTAGDLLAKAMDAAWKNGRSANERTEITVREARLAGFVDAEVVCRTLIDGTEYIDVIAQYRYVWLRSCQPRNGAIGDYTRDVFAKVVADIRAGKTEQDLKDKVQQLVAGKYTCEFSCIPEAHIETGGDFRLQDEMSVPLDDGVVVAPVLTVYAGDEVVIASDTLVVGLDKAESLTQRNGGKNW